MATAKIMAMIRALNFPALNISLKYTLPDLSAQLYGANRVRDLEARQIQIRIRQPAMGVPTMELPAATSEPRLRRLDRLLPKCGLSFTEAQRAGFRAATMGWPA